MEKKQKDVNQFTYLDSKVNIVGGTDKDIKCHIGRAAAVFKILWPIWTSKEISERTKIRISNSNVKSVLLYVCETWRITKTSTHKLQTFINRRFRNNFKKTIERSHYKRRAFKQVKTTTYRHSDKKKKMDMGWTFVKKNSNQACFKVPFVLHCFYIHVQILYRGNSTNRNTFY